MRVGNSRWKREDGRGMKGEKTMSHKLPEGLYGITAEKFSRGRSNVEVVEEMIRGGIRIIQYREKHKDKSIREIYEECRAIRNITREHGVLFIVNDFIDIAVLTDAVRRARLGENDKFNALRRLSRVS